MHLSGDESERQRERERETERQSERERKVMTCVTCVTQIETSR